ncbi:hypothetical protein M409DRAFT_54342 [Zasmidium cellare ATCC 36951]|uniref:AB hydrolase-1 domain-containing protein n=1 Tax=Zasmidium cellare ATCC 36951 TaxID=1080233 RepID=A0A6A6CJ24_ZASCE|nr:uncharacterized protein M409DRAFT_54342 [Zasmidium cellare ATCC 36951]KAF2167145.1 hypothetical protein M409DRAFT_54342 [Zasmidium cellare ATCC 36951]
MIPISISSTNTVFNFTHWSDDFALEQFLAGATTRPDAGFSGIVEGTVQIDADYNIAASFCTPKYPSGYGKEKEILLATHGIGPGREHWNSAYKPETYNFVQHAIDRRYSVFFYDRLGCGLSSKLSGYEAQLSQGIAVLRELATIVRGGQYTGAIGMPSKLALIGFSYGSYITHFTITDTPDIADAVVLTGIGLNTTGVNGNGLLRSFAPRIASAQKEKRFAQLDSGYLSWADILAMTLNYFYYLNYEVAAAEYTERKKQAFSIGEFLTFNGGFYGNYDASRFTGSALAITAETDYIVCDGYSPGIYDEPADTYYRNAKKFVKHLVPEASHNINFHKNAPATYGVILDFLSENM